MIDFTIHNSTIDSFLDAINEYALYNTVLGIVTLIFTYLSVMLFNRVAMNQIYRIRGLFFRSVLNQDVAWYDFNQSGELASRMNEDLIKLEDGLGEKNVMFLHFFLTFFGSIVLAFVKGWELTLICLTSFPLTFISMGIVATITSKLAKQEMVEYGKAGSIAEEVFSSIRTVFAFGGQEKEIDRYKKNLVSAKKINIKKGIFAGTGFGLLWFFIYASYALAFWYGVGLVIRERYWNPTDRVYTPGNMIMVFLSVIMASMNIGMASPYIDAFGVAKGAGAKIFQIIEQIPKINPLRNEGKRLTEPLQKIIFKNVHFQYPSRPDVKVLKGLNLSINRGETVALVGTSGCGKSTCIQLLQRFYDPIDGEILLNNESVTNLNVNYLREKIGVVGQEPILFSASIYENIRYGKENAKREEIENAAIAANAHTFIKNLPNGYNTLVGERGTQLSGGQKQRIAIARALIRDPEILLLDEATSALDTASESKVQAALEKASQGRTTIIIAHRLSTIRGADKIVVIDNGQVVERGNHEELLRLKGHYSKLVTAQLDTNEDDFKQTKKKISNLKRVDEDEISFNKFENEDSKINKSTDSKNISLLKIIKLNSTEWPYILIGSIAAIVVGLAMPVFAVLFGDIVGLLSSLDDNYVRTESHKYCFYYLAAGIIVGLATFLQFYLFSIAGETLTERLRVQAFSAMLKQEIAWFDDESNGTGTLCARLSTDAAAIQGATGQRIGTVLQSLSTLFVGIGLSFYYQWKLGLVALSFTPLIFVSSFLHGKVMTQQNLGTRKALENSTKLAVEVISNIRTVMSLGREKMFHQNYLKLLAPSLEGARRNTHYRGLVYGTARSLMYFAFSACIYYGGYLVIHEGLFFADIFKVSQALIMGTVTIANTLAFTPNFQKGIEAAEQIFSLLERLPKILDPSEEKIPSNSEDEGSVRYQLVDFTYPTRKNIQVLKQLSLDINRGQMIALVGPSGCGKSTCIQLLERFYDVDSGSLLVNKCDVRQWKINHLRKQMGIVSQEPILFDRTIADNIAYGDNFRQVTEAEIIEAAKKANIHNFITSLPLGYDTRLGEKGTQLSGGQKQRIAIARALIRNPKILLLDEATSALDAESEKIVQEALDTARVGRTCISIAHRLSTIIDSDVIFVLDSGQIVEKGTHQELLSKRGIYYNLYKIQSGKQ